jgi:prefoldin subunit 5
MNDEISLKNEELRYIRNDAMEMDKEILALKDDIKKVNKCNSDLKV